MKTVSLLRYSLILLAMMFLQGCAMFSLNPAQNPPREQYVAAQGATPVVLESADQLSLFGQWWLPEGPNEPRGVVLLLHGTIAHSG